MTQVTLKLIWLTDGEVLVPATTLSEMLRDVATEVGVWPQQGADPVTVEALRDLLGKLADRIDTDCIALASELDERDECDELDDLDDEGTG